MTRISDELRSAVAERAGHACEYCRLPDRLQAGGFELDHIVPASRGGPTALDNLAYSCPHCNDHKWAHVEGLDSATGDTVSLLHPRQDRWDDHFGWSKQRLLHIIGKTPTGRATIARLQLNHAELVEIRRQLAAFGVLVIPQDRR
ncbi:MAG: HNH endonuclease [Pirellulaceae bacterium]|nr:HNH endonuclease [Pirellulaceae bacterium]